MPMYQVAMAALPQSMTVPGRWQPARVTAAVLCFFALVMVVAGLFLPLYSGELTIDGGTVGGQNSLEMTFNAWSVEYDDPSMNAAPGEALRLGYPLVFAAVGLICAAVACWAAANPGAGRTAGRVAGTVTAVSAAFMVGTVWTIALLVTNAVDSILLLGTLSQGIATDAIYLVGFWFLLFATLLGLVAAVLSLLPSRRPEWVPPQAPVNPFLPTPPYGIPIPPQAAQGLPVVHPMRMAPMAPVDPGQGRVHAVDPLTGQPLPTPAVDQLTVRPGAVDPLTGQPLTQSPPTGVPVQPFSPEPVRGVNGASPAQAAPVVLPEAPPSPPGPAVPASEDPLAEPPRT
ncbi:hypothetical protein CLV71_112275 [Actinophytocola oryzae]|uniref:Uncharacterized protein n=2 Tax=Actinophytocola oryzae TaxID=502181 RepID=A0A4R7V9I2_9PSEU|nr:hypothetical protein CLV71_112275 [Actinophytocola oryzae]